MKKSARVSEKLVSPGLPGLQVATRLLVLLVVIKSSWTIVNQRYDTIMEYKNVSENKTSITLVKIDYLHIIRTS